MRRRKMLATLTALFGGKITSAFETTQKKNVTFVLIHGAWHGGWCWKKVSALLQCTTHKVYTPTLTGLGERSHLLSSEIDLQTHIQDIVSLLEYEDLHDVTLVGHSYGGMVITGVADKARTRVNHVVYLDAFLPENGKSLSHYVSINFEEMAKANGDGWKVSLPGRNLKNLGITNQEDIDWMLPRIGPQPLKTFTQPLAVSTSSQITLKKSYIQLTDNRPHFNEAATRAREYGFQCYKLLSGGHDAMVTKPAELVELLNITIRKWDNE